MKFGFDEEIKLADNLIKTRFSLFFMTIITYNIMFVNNQEYWFKTHLSSLYVEFYLFLFKHDENQSIC